MSLVSYSVDSDTDDNDDVDNSVVESVLAIPQSSSESRPVSTNSSLFNSIPQPVKISQKSTLVDEHEGGLEDIVTPAPSKIANLITSYRKPGKPIQISAPVLIENDDEDVQPSRKRLRSSSTKCGLFDLLPPPKMATIKQPNRVLLPHSLMKTKKSQELKSVSEPENALHFKKDKETLNEVEDEENYDSKAQLSESTADVSSFKEMKHNDFDVREQDRTSGRNFFSLEENTEITKSSVSDKHQNLVTTNVYSLHLDYPTPDSLSSHNYQTSNTQLPTPSPTPKISTSDCQPLKFSTTTDATKAYENFSSQDLPLQFSNQLSDHRSFSNISTYSAVSKVYGAIHGCDFSSSEAHSSAEHSVDQHADLPPGNQFENDEEFARLQGRVGRMKEKVDIIDVMADDMSGQVNLLKNISQEVSDRPRRPKKGEMPTYQQRRKHQITYLAFQAKEKELDLKNQWSQNRMTRRQTQSKYGF